MKQYGYVRISTKDQNPERQILAYVAETERAFIKPNKLHLPMKHGVIDAARKTGVPIIPVVHEYKYEKRNDSNL